MTILMILSRLGRKATDDDPFLDPMANPNIRVGGQWIVFYNIHFVLTQNLWLYS